MTGYVVVILYRIGRYPDGGSYLAGPFLSPQQARDWIDEHGAYWKDKEGQFEIMKLVPA